MTPSGRRAAAEVNSSGPMVDMSIQTCPGSSAVAMPSAPKRTSSTASGLANMVITNSAPFAAALGVAATSAPTAARGVARCAVRFQTVTSLPASMSRRAIWVPIIPRPKKAILDIRCLLRFLGRADPDGPASHSFRRRSRYTDRLGEDVFQRITLGGAEFDVTGGDHGLELRRTAGADDGHVDAGVRCCPGDGQLGQGQAQGLGEPLEALDHLEVVGEVGATEISAVAAPVVGGT